VKETNPLGFSTQLAYDANDNVTSLTDADNNTTSWQYDALNRVTQETNQLGASRLYQYDANDNLTQETDRNGHVRQFAYDPLNRLTSETWVGGNYTQSRSYDAAGRLTSISDPSSSFQYGYDAVGRVTSIDNAGTPGTPHVVQTQGYDAVGNRTSVAATVNGVADYTNNYQFDALNRETQVMQSGTGVSNKRVDTTYTPTDQFATIKRYSDLAGTQLVASSTYVYDNANQLTSLDHTKAGGALIAHYGYTYDAAGRMTQMVSPDGTSNYAYDRAGQLTDATYTFQAAEHFTWDPNGNRTGTGYVIGADNRLLSDGVNNYQYDAEGNRISQTNIATGAVTNYQWDYRNRLTQVSNTTQTVSNTYDVFDRRIGKSVTAGSQTTTQRFVYNGLNMVLAFDGTGATTDHYLRGAAFDQIFADDKYRSGLGGSALWGLGDHQGTIRDVVDSTGTMVDHRKFGAFGNLTGQTNPATSYRFYYTGKELDTESGLQYNWKRFYNSSTGSWMSNDPAGFAAGDTSLYAYAGNSPTTFTDPTGLIQASILKTFAPESTLERIHWHHLLPQALFEKLRIIGIDIHSAEYGYLFVGFDHIGKGGIHCEKWNEAWEEFLTLMKERNIALTKRLVDLQLKRMMRDPRFKRFFTGKVGKKAMVGYLLWPTYKAGRLAEKKALEFLKRRAGKLAKKAQEMAAKKGCGTVAKKVAKNIIPGVAWVIAFFSWSQDVEAKGVVGGTANSILDGLPVVGWGKLIAELIAGQDVIPDQDIGDIDVSDVELELDDL
jgi:RHS repeat-associated protein